MIMHTYPEGPFGVAQMQFRIRFKKTFHPVDLGRVTSSSTSFLRSKLCPLQLQLLKEVVHTLNWSENCRKGSTNSYAIKNKDESNR